MISPFVVAAQQERESCFKDAEQGQENVGEYENFLLRCDDWQGREDDNFNREITQLLIDSIHACLSISSTKIAWAIKAHF